MRSAPPPSSPDPGASVPSPSRHTPHIVVVGAGPGGSVAALLLARGGLRVTLIERQRFPRDKVCGECISATGIAVLDRCGLSGRLLRHAPARFTRTALIAPDGAQAVHDLTLAMWGLTRRTMDAELLGAAGEAGARVIQPARAESIRPGPDGVAVEVRSEDNLLSTLTADYVLLADGKSALMGTKPAATTDLGIKAHFRGVDADPGTIYLFSLNGHYGGLAAVEDGLWNIALSVPQRKVRDVGGDLVELWNRLATNHTFLRQAFRAATLAREFLASPLPRFPVRTDWPDRVVLVGNAAAALEPIGGEGMGLAMRSAELAAEAVLGALGSDRRLDAVALQAAYGRLWRARRTACRTVAIAMSMPLVARTVVPLSRVADSATRAVLGLMGKATDR